MAGVLTIDELAARCDHFGSRAAGLFELSGRWSAVAEHDQARTVLARLSTYCATHVEWWDQRRPSSNLPDGGSPALDDAAQRVAVATAALADEGPTALGLRGLHELLSQLSADLAQWAGEHDPDVDAPTVRVLELVLADLGDVAERLEATLVVAEQP
jgi:hypothetical protein